MPRLKQIKLQGFQALICHHPTTADAPHDDLGRKRCLRCGHKVTVVLTRKAFDLACKQMLERST